MPDDTALETPLRTNGLTPLEIATHVLVGRHAPAANMLESIEPGSGPVAVLEQSLLEALLRPPCVVSFSGGRDSSTLLSLATRVARREGLDDPIPATLRYPSVPETQEDDWQELVVSHLRLDNWERRTFEDELDLVGPVAQEVMRRHGLPYPYNLHLQVPVMEIARTGTFITGLGGDEAFTPSPRIWAVLMGRVRPRRRDLLPIAARLAPRPVRRTVYAREPGLTMPWLTPEASRELGRQWVEEGLRIPLRWDKQIREWWLSRYVHTAIERVAQLGADFDLATRHPFAERGFIMALAREVGGRGFDAREALVKRLFGDTLPDAVARRRTKASFDAVLWNKHAREFVGELLDGPLRTALRTLQMEEIVDPQTLTSHWRLPDRRANSFLLIQSCWFALRG